MDDSSSKLTEHLNDISVAVVIPVFNGRDTIGRAIESAKEQTHPPSEIAVVDDASTDGTREFVQKKFPDVTLLSHQTNRGGSAARNSGVRATSSEVIAYLDADDEWLKRTLEDQLQVLRTSTEKTAGVYCGFTRKRSVRDELVVSIWHSLFSEFKIDDNPPGDRRLIPHILSGSFYFGGASTFIVRRSSHQDIGGWDETFERHQDWQYVIELVRAGYTLERCPKRLVEKYDTSPPSGQAVERASAKLLSKYEEQVLAAEQKGFGVKEFHAWSIATAYFRAGDFRAGWNRLGEVSSPTLPRMAQLLYAIWQGAQRGLSRIV